jgi:hypothetical protein
MEKVLGLLKSRTVWTLVIMFLYNTVVSGNSTVPVPTDVSPWVNGIFTLVAIYFRINPVQTMGVIPGISFLSSSTASTTTLPSAPSMDTLFEKLDEVTTLANQFGVTTEKLREMRDARLR